MTSGHRVLIDPQYKKFICNNLHLHACKRGSTANLIVLPGVFYVHKLSMNLLLQNFVSYIASMVCMTVTGIFGLPWNWYSYN